MSAPTRSDARLIELERVAAGYSRSPGALVVEDVNWIVASGDFWLVGGLPGCGKSQVLQTAAGFLPPLAGQHRLFGECLSDLPPDEADRRRRRVGYVFADGGRLFNDLTVAGNVALPLCYHQNCGFDAVAQGVRELLEVVSLRPFADWLPTRLNRTLRQRAALARTLALAPEVLLLDDPLGGIDPRQTRWWVDIVANLMSGEVAPRQRPAAVIVAADHLRPWLASARQFAVIKDGRWQTLADGASSTECAWRELLADAGTGE